MSSTTPNSAHPATLPAQLDNDEKRILAVCERESLMYRSIPLGLVTFFATQFAMSKNVITTKAKWFKLGAGLFAGYIIGKVSYAPTCRKKILTEIPNSNLAYAIRGIGMQQGAPTDEHDPINFASSRPSKDPSEAVVFVPDPVELDTHTLPMGVNQYGDPIYTISK